MGKRVIWRSTQMLFVWTLNHALRWGYVCTPVLQRHPVLLYVLHASVRPDSRGFEGSRYVRSFLISLFPVLCSLQLQPESLTFHHKLYNFVASEDLRRKIANMTPNAAQSQQYSRIHDFDHSRGVKWILILLPPMPISHSTIVPFCLNDEDSSRPHTTRPRPRPRCSLPLFRFPSFREDTD